MLSSKALGNKIKSLREQRGFTQSQLATRMNVSRAAVSNWELGNRLPDISMLGMFCWMSSAARRAVRS